MQDDKDLHRNNVILSMLFTALALVAIFMLFLIFPSCSAERKMAALAVRHPDAALKVCAMVAPTKKEIVTNTETRTVEGPTVFKYDTVQADCDTVYKVGGKRIVRIPCPPSTHQTDSVFTTVTITVTKTDETQVNALQKELTACSVHADQMQKSRSKWRWIALGLIAFIVAFGAFKIFGKVNPLNLLKKKQA